MIAVVLPIPPSANHRYRMTRKGSVVLTEEARTYVAIVQSICIQQEMLPLAGELSITIDVYARDRRTDTDNYLKSPLDALQGYAYRNDSQIKRICITRYVDKQNPRLEVSVFPFAHLTAYT